MPNWWSPVIHVRLPPRAWPAAPAVRSRPACAAWWCPGGRCRLRDRCWCSAPAAAWRTVLPGQRVRLDGRLEPPLSGGLLAATLSARTDPVLLGRPPPWQRVAGAVRAGLQRASAGLPELARGLLPGLVDGDTSRLDPVLANRFQTAGLTHLVAVSGTNLSFVVGAVALLLRRLRASPRTIAVLGALVVIGFVLIARPSPSVLRAAVMAGIALAALATGRQRSAVPVLAAASLVLLVWQPDLAASLGFALSVAATAALLLIAPGWADGLRRRGLPPGIAEPIAVAAAAHLVTVPLIAGLSGRVSLVAIPANVLAEPVVAAGTVLGLLAAVSSLCCLPVAVLFADLAGWPCRWLVWVAEYFGALPGAFDTLAGRRRRRPVAGSAAGHRLGTVPPAGRAGAGRGRPHGRVTGADSGAFAGDRLAAVRLVDGGLRRRAGRCDRAQCRREHGRGGGRRPRSGAGGPVPARARGQPSAVAGVDPLPPRSRGWPGRRPA